LIVVNWPSEARFVPSLLTADGAGQDCSTC
jgi:hypothetical protein